MIKPNLKTFLGALNLILFSPVASTLAQQTPFLDPIFETVVTSDIQYGTGSVGNPATGRIPLHLDIYQPSGDGLPAKSPGFLVIHGGGFTTGTKDAITIVQLCETYARRGYVAASIRYRLAGDDPTSNSDQRRAPTRCSVP